ncbi:MAG TPA: hypothetical protein PKC12_06270 [Thiobacillaceae bacterium]|nr:hypothetical protein [Thiobacillaceae bacterium]
MPPVVTSIDCGAWLGAKAGALTHTLPAVKMVAYPVSPLFDKARNDVACPDLVELR